MSTTMGDCIRENEERDREMENNNALIRVIQETLEIAEGNGKLL